MQGICSNRYVFVAAKESEKNISGMDGEYELGIHRIKGQRPPTAFTRLIRISKLHEEGQPRRNTRPLVPPSPLERLVEKRHSSSFKNPRWNGM